jgi:hypothetical protein
MRLRTIIPQWMLTKDIFRYTKLRDFTTHLLKVLKSTRQQEKMNLERVTWAKQW